MSFADFNDEYFEALEGEGDNPALAFTDSIVSVEEEEATAKAPAPGSEICQHCWKPKRRHHPLTGVCPDAQTFEGSGIFTTPNA